MFSAATQIGQKIPDGPQRGAVVHGMPVSAAANPWASHPVTTAPRPMICETEVGVLAQHYGPPRRRSFHIQADEYIRAYRWRKESDRRAEVVVVPLHAQLMAGVREKGGEGHAHVVGPAADGARARRLGSAGESLLQSAR